jgi:cyclopropane fatty-acyl-phospholipid synthase-like methyltransferase
MSDDAKRIVNQQVDLDKSALLEFFDGRGSKYDEQNPYVSVLYQDKNKALAASRDLSEKKRITPLLGLDGRQRLLDIGCGVGRWADSILSDVDFYLGVDFSAALIERANARFAARDQAHFSVMDAKHVSRERLREHGLFDRIIISGVLLYMNDDEVRQVFEGIAGLCSADCRIYIREPLAYTDRLTLNEFWSEELNASYSAIYRTVAEMNHLLTESFRGSSFQVQQFRQLYDDAAMNNRAETAQFFTIFDNVKKS